MGAACWRGFCLLIAGFLLSACQTTSGTEYAVVSQQVGPPRAGQARIVIMAEKAPSFGVQAVADIKVDGVEAGEVVPGKYIYVDRPAGRNEIVATQTLFPGDTKHAITTAPGRTYFLLARASGRAKAIVGLTMVGGIAGGLVTAAVTSGNENPGPIDLSPLEEAAARTTLAELQLAKKK
jgi:hypothetical protein